MLSTHGLRGGSSLHVRVMVGALLAAALIIGWLALGALSVSHGTGASAATPYAGPTRGGTGVTFKVVTGAQPTPTPAPTPKPTHAHGGGGLPVTGNGPVLMWTVVGGVALLAVGGVLIAATRR